MVDHGNTNAPSQRAPVSRLRHAFAGTCLALSIVTSLALAALFRNHAPDLVLYYVTYRPAWVWFALMLPFAIFAFFGAKRSWSFIAVGVWLVCLALSEEAMPLLRAVDQRAHSDFDALHAAGPTTGKAAFRVATWNIHGRHETVDEELALLGRYDPDVVCLQEVPRNRIVPDAMLRSEKFSAFHFVHIVNCAVMSRFPVEDVSVRLLPRSRGHVVRISFAPGLTAMLVNVHMPPAALVAQIWPRRGWTRLEGQAELLRRQFMDLGEVARLWAGVTPVLVVGDFNAPGNYDAVRSGLDPLRDTFLLAGHGWGKTFSAAIPASRIDMIYASQAFEAVDCRALPRGPSDHRAVIADLVLQPAQESGDAVSTESAAR